MAEDMFAPDGNERINLRPWILAVCFMWGAVCGFFIHAWRPRENRERKRPQIARPEEIGTTGQAAATDGASAPAVENIGKRRVEPDVVPPTLAAGQGEGEAPRTMSEAIAEPPPPALDCRIGLSGATARPPFPMAVAPPKTSKPSRQPPVLLPPEIR